SSPKVEKKTIIPTATKKEFVKPEKPVRRSVRPFYKRTTLTKRSYYQRFNTGRKNSNLQLNDKGFVDSGCSRHMTGNITHLSNFKDFDGGYCHTSPRRKHEA
ncbi:hypothetical protein Tco_0175754, partial [Tanacetum coccineum]